MEFREIPMALIDLSDSNVRKNLDDGQEDSSIVDLANSIARQGLLNPVTVVQQPTGRFSLIAGQRRFLACSHLDWKRIPALVRGETSDTDATSISLVENVHRADMNPRDKARAFGILMQQLNDARQVAKETGVGVATVKKYLSLLDLSSTLQEKLAAGEAKNTEALAELAKRFQSADDQEYIWEEIGAFGQREQLQIIKGLKPDLSNLDELRNQALEGAFRLQPVNCPFVSCPVVPTSIRGEVAELVNVEAGGSIEWSDAAPPSPKAV